MRLFCSDCEGTGKQTKWKEVNSNDKIVTLQKERVVCERCDGKGYAEHVSFTLKEAEAIIKHCGLNIEGSEW